MIVLHYTAMDTAEAALTRLCAPEHEVSAHYLICEKGRMFQLVPEAARAWHAGRGQWGRVTDVNSHSIGVELANPGAHPYPEPQMAALEALLQDVAARWSIPPARVIGHSDMAPARKQDPGPKFDWQRLAMQGLSVWPEAKGAQIPASEEDQYRFWGALRRFGYPPSRGVLAAFRARFHTAPMLAPVLEADVAAADDLTQHHPCVDPGLRAG